MSSSFEHFSSKNRPQFAIGKYVLIIKDFLQILALQESLVGVKKLVEQKPRQGPRALVVLSTTTIDAPQTASHKNLISIESKRYEPSTTVICHSVLPSAALFGISKHLQKAGPGGFERSRYW